MTRKNNSGGGETIVCAPAEALEQARYWYQIVRAHLNEVTIRGFCEATALLSPGQGIEARQLIHEAKRRRREIEKQDWKSTKLTMRWRHARAFIIGLENGATPIVRGYASRSGTLVRCPWCGSAERHEVSTPEDEITVECQTYECANYIVRLTRLPILIGPYIPTQEAAQAAVEGA